MAGPAHEVPRSLEFRRYSGVVGQERLVSVRHCVPVTIRQRHEPNLELVFGASLYDLKQADVPDPADVIARDGSRRFSSPAALVRIPESFFARQVQQGNWNPDGDDGDRKGRDALAARGYWQAFQNVKGAVADIIADANPGARARTSHMDWYRELFQPCVAAGIVPAMALAGYRKDAVYLRTSRYVPPRWEAVREAMPALFDLLENETDPGVRAVLGHWLFGYIHPYSDGNGRMARFVMNAMLASGGYPWTVIRVEDRDPYLSALDRASIGMDIAPFATFIAQRVRWSIDHAPAPRERRSER